MNVVSADKQRNGRVVTPERQTGLEVVLLKRTYVFPYSQFLFAEGGDDEIKAVFATNDLVIRGTALGGLLAELASQRLARLEEPVRGDRFDPTQGPIVRQVIVETAQASPA